MNRFLMVALITVSLAMSFSAQAERWFVRAGGDDRADGKTPATAFRTITRAVGVLNHGDAIIIGPGEYKESVLIAERFSAAGALMAIIGDEDGEYTGDKPGAVVLTPAKPTQLAMTLHRMDGIWVSGLTFRGPGQGLKVDKCRNVRVERCTFDGLSRGLVVSGGTNTIVWTSVFSRNIIGMLATNSSNTGVANVTVAGSTSVGVLLLSCGPGDIRNSILTANNTNMIADALSSQNWTSDYNVMTGTIGNWGDVPAVAKIHEWPAASGQDRNSLFVAPAFADPDNYDLRISPEVTWGGGLPGMAVGVINEPVGRKLQKMDRDGKRYRVYGEGRISVGAYAYPEPVLAKGWVKLAAKVEGEGPRQSAGVYTENGELVRTLLADAVGVSELYWDGLDDLGHVAPEGKYVTKVVTSDLRVVDDGAFGDNGNPMGMYQCDQAERVCALSDGGFLVVALWDEAMYPIRRISSTGQPTAAIGLANVDFAAIVSVGEDDIYGLLGRTWPGLQTKPTARIIRLALPGDRAHMLDGSEQYVIVTDAEKEKGVLGIGMAVVGEKAYVTMSGLNVVRVIDLTNGKKLADWPVANVGDIAADPNGGLWVVSGSKLVHMALDGKKGKEINTELEAPKHIAASKDYIAVVADSEKLGGPLGGDAPRLHIMDTAGNILKKFGKPRPPGEYTPISLDLLRDPRGMCFLNDGRLVLCEYQRTRILDPESGVILQELISTFVDTGIPHPTRPEYVYCQLGVFHVDPKSGAWEWLAEAPYLIGPNERSEAREDIVYSLRMPSIAVVLGGRPFITYENSGSTIHFVDVSDPVNPRVSVTLKDKVLPIGPYQTFSFAGNSDMICAYYGPNGERGTFFARVPFKGLDENNDPVFDFENVVRLGQVSDPVSGLMSKDIVSVDPTTDEIYFGAVTTLYNKMVPGWGADATGVGKCTPEGKPVWFSLSSGGNYMAAAAINDGQRTLFLACKSFGGQVDVFDADGLRLGTGNWSFPNHYIIGFVDVRYGLSAYMRPDGKIGAYVEDDAIGRLSRLRIDGAETIERKASAFAWKPTGAAAGEAPLASEVRGKGLEKMQAIPKVASLPVGGDWSAWEKAGVVPQMIILPAVSYRHAILPEDLWQTMSLGTAIGAIAHDGKNLYVYFVVTDEPQCFHAETPGMLYQNDGIELWLEQDQFGLGLTRDGAAHLYKYRFHDREGKPYTKSYSLDKSNIHATALSDVAAHPLGRQLGDIVGVSLKGRKGYMVMGRIPMEEVRLVGGIAGRGGNGILPMTGRGGEILRVGVALDGNMTWGRAQDYKVFWPNSLMFSDPTRLAPFVLKE